MRVRNHLSRASRAAALALALACGSDDRAPEPSGAAAPEHAAAAPARPAEPPCEGLTEPDRRALVTELLEERFADLDAELRRLQRSFETEKACESWAWSGLTACCGAGSRFPDHLDAWVAAMPGAWTAYASRGRYWTDLGFARRGTRVSAETPPEAFAAMREAFARALPDLRRAVELEPKHLPSYLDLIRIAAAAGTREDRDRALEAALELDPLSHSFRIGAMEWLAPAWGGSLEALRRLAAFSPAQLRENPRLGRVPAQAKAFEARASWRKRDLASATRLFEEAIAMYPGDFVRDAFALFEKQGEHERLIRSATRVVEYWEGKGGSTAGWVYAYRGTAYLQIGNRARAEEDIAHASELAPTDAWVQARRAVFVELTQGRAEALPRYEKLWEQDRDDRWLAERLADALQAQPARRSEAVPVLRRVTELAPDDARAWLAYGTLLRELGDPQARPALERYLALADAGDPDARNRKRAVERMLQGAGAEQESGVGDAVLPAFAQVQALVEARRAEAVRAGTQ